MSDQNGSATGRAASGFLSGLSVTTKFALALSLFLAPLAFVTVNLTAEQQKAIEFADRERIGLSYLVAVTSAEEALREWGAEGAQRDQIVSALDALSRAQARHGPGLGIDRTFAAARAQLETLVRSAVPGPDNIANARTALARLRRDIGDKSNLILDPDLDSYYSMDVVLIRLPGLQDALYALDGNMHEPVGADSTPDDSSAMASAVTLFRNARAELDFSIEAGFRGARDGRLRDSLMGPQQRSRSLGEASAVELQQSAVSPIRGRASRVELQEEAASSLTELGQSATLELDRLLRERVDRFERARNFVLALAALLFSAALVTTVLLLRHGVIAPMSLFTRAIRSLAQGDYDHVVPLQDRRDEVGEMSRALEVLRNVARDKIAADAARSAADSANKAKSQFIANMSHELRTPLNAVIGYTEIVIEDLESHEPDYAPAQDLKRVISAASHLLALIDGILDLAKIEAGHQEIELTDFDPIAVASEAISVTQPLAAKNATLLAWRGVGGLGSINSDARRLKQCLINLISNACKFTRDGRVEISAQRQFTGGTEFVIFEIKDDGIGMNADQLSRVFRPFQQADSSIAGRYGGTGLGLSITREFARLLGGDVWIESAPGIGTTAFLSVATGATSAPEDAAQRNGSRNSSDLIADAA